jgi:glycosyltransferase involved in cell wall biosynthesis
MVNTITPKVSIIIPTLNRSYLLKRSVESAFNQSYSNFEVIVSNNNSNDGTLLELSNLKERFGELIIVNHQKRLSLSEHWDTVINKFSEGEYILLIPDDDILIDPDYLCNAVGLFHKYKSVGLVFANYFIVNQDFVRVSEVSAGFDSFVSKDFLYANYNNDLFGVKGVGVSHLTAIFSKKAYDGVNGFDLDCMCPDTYLWLKILLEYDAGFIREKVAEYLIHDSNLSDIGSVEYRYLDTKIIPEIENYSKKNNLYKVFMRDTFSRMSLIFYRRFYNVILKNILNNREVVKSVRYFIKVNPYFFVLVVLKKFRSYVD